MRKTKLVSWLLIVIFLGTIFIGGCGKPQTTAPSPDGQADVPPKTYQPIDLNFATWQPPTYPNNTKVFEPFAEAVTEKTEGRVKMYLQPGGVLAKGDETYDAVVTGMVDVGFSLQAYTPGRFPLTTILEFPFMFSSSLQACQAAAELFKSKPAFLKEYDDVKVIMVGGTDTAALMSAKPINTLDDLKGLKIRTPGPITNDMVTAFGGTPVSMPYPDVYDAMQRGIVDATFGPQTSIFAFNLHEVSSHIVLVDFYTTVFYVVMNKTAWDKISPEDQAIVQELIEQIPQTIGELYDGRIDGFRKDIQKEVDAGNVTVVTFSEEDMKKARSILEPLEDKWLSDMEAKGLPGREIYSEVKALAEKYKK